MRRETISNFQKKFLPKLSAESAQTLSEKMNEDSFAINNVDIHTHPTGANVGFYDKGYTPSKKPSDVLRDLLLVKSNDSYGCRMQGLEPSDKYVRADQLIHVSRFAITNGHGDACAHELGHWLSDQISKDKLSEHSAEKLLSVRSCVQGFYPKEKTPQFYLVDGDKFRSEEDFADWVQAQVGTEKGLWCDMKQSVAMFNSYANAETYTPDPHDEHSNYLFREISVKLNRGEKLPKICEDMMGAYPDFRPKKCEMK